MAEGVPSGSIDVEDAGARLNSIAASFVRFKRLERGLTQEGLAAVCGLDRTYVSAIERGERNVTALNILRIADALAIKPSEIFRAAGL